MPTPLTSIRAFSLALLIATPPLRAVELIDPAALGFGPPAFTLDTTYQGTLDYENGNGGLETFEVRTVAPLAKWNVGNWILGASLNYAKTHADFGSQLNLGTKELQTVKAQIFAAYRLEGSPWWALGFLSPGVATDFEDVGSGSFTATSLALLGYRWSPRLDVAGGVFASYGLNEATIIPAIGFIWRPNDQWIVQATPPIVAIGWRPNADWTVGLVSYPGGGEWEVGGKGDAVRQVDLSLWRAAVSVERKVGAHWRVSARAGVAFGGELELRDREERVLKTTDLDAAPFGALAVKWAF